MLKLVVDRYKYRPFLSADIMPIIGSTDIGSISADTIVRLSAFADNRHRYHNLQLPVSEKNPYRSPLAQV